MNSSSSWCTVESDPGVFTELISNMGVPGVQVEEMYEMDSLLTQDQEKCPIYGIVFLFKWTAQMPRETVEPANGLFFANQVVTNACATQAILSILLNQDGKIELGKELEAFQEFTCSMSAEVKGMAIGNSELIRNVHNSFARPEPFIMEDKPSSSEGSDAFHFISYVPYRGTLYELDGLQKGPIDLGSCTKDDWLLKAKEEVQKRIEQGGAEIRFNLMTVGKSLQDVYDKELSECNQKKEALQLRAAAGGDDGATAQAELIQLDDQIQQLHISLEQEREKRKNYKVENMRRKHNYIPFLLKFLKILAEKGQLNGLVEKARNKS